MTLGILLTLNVLCWIIFILVFRVVLRRSVRPQRILNEIEAELGSLLTEMNGTTDRNIRLIEESIRRLKEQVVQADKRIRILQGEKEKGVRPSSEYTHLAVRKPLAIEIVEEPQVSDPVFAEPVVTETGEEDNINIRILNLYKQGLDARLIAGKVGRPLGEVELIISLSETTDR